MVARISRAVEADIDHEQAGGGALEQDFLRRRHHRKAALGMAEQVLRGDDDGEILNRARPDQIAPGRPQPRLSVPAGMKISSAPRSASARVTSGM